jgi:hypothetical protein
MRKLLLSVLLVSITAILCWGSEPNVSGHWVYSMMGSRIEAEIAQSGKLLNGVAYVFDAVGNKNTYHFKGAVENGKIAVQHSNGHVFNGSVTPSGRLVGVLRTKNGHRVNIDAEKR